LGEAGRGAPDFGAQVGGVDEDLATAIRQALTCSRSDCARYGAEFSWDRSLRQFLSGLVGFDIAPEALAA
jgi:hypothetical protein